MPAPLSNKKVFFQKKSAWCRDPASAADPARLKRGQNDWSYVVGLSVLSAPDWPLIATATASATDLTYTKVTSARGGVWDGTDAIVGCVDGSARHLAADKMNLKDKTKTFPKRPDFEASIFIATPEWLGTGRVILAPE
jgi:hypothetical protein